MSKVTILTKPNRIVIASKGVQGAPGKDGVITPELEGLRDEAHQAAQDAAGSATIASDAAGAAVAAQGAAEDSAGQASASAALAEQARLLGATIGFATKADMDASLAHPDGTLALVTSDPTPANNGTYRKTGASGSGSWVQSADRVTGLEGRLGAVEEALILDHDLAEVVAWVKRNRVNAAIYDVSVPGSVFRSVGGDVASPGDTVKRINDLSGNGHHLTRTHATNNILLERDPSSHLRVSIPYGGFINSWPNTVTLRSKAYIAAGFANRLATSSAAIFGVAANNANGIMIRSVSSLSRVAAFLIGDGLGSVSIQSGATSFPKDLPGVLDAYHDSGAFSSWVNGSSLERREEWALYDGGVRTLPTIWGAGHEIAGAYISVTSNVYNASNGSAHFYCGIWVDGEVPIGVRKSINRWMLRRTGRLAILAPQYDVFLPFGQSQVQGVGTADEAPLVPRGGGASWHNFGFLQPMAEPNRHHRANNSLSGSMWSSFANGWRERAGNPALIISNGASGCGIFSAGPDGWWRPGTSSVRGLVEASVVEIRKALQWLDANGVAYQVRGILWCGGEQDVAALTSGSVSPEQWRDGLLDVLSRARTRLGIADLPLGVISSDRRTDPTHDLGYERLRAAQAMAADGSNAGVYMAMPYQDFVGQGKMSDTTHWNQQALNEAGAIAATNSADHLGILPS